MADDLAEVIYNVSPPESPFFSFTIIRHNRRRLGPAHGGMRARRRRVARAQFKPASKRARRFEWVVG